MVVLQRVVPPAGAGGKWDNDKQNNINNWDNNLPYPKSAKPDVEPEVKWDNCQQNMWKSLWNFKKGKNQKFPS